MRERTVVHRLLWSSRNEAEHAAVMAECQRVAGMGGTFCIVNEYQGNWYSVVTIYYPQQGETR